MADDITHKKQILEAAILAAGEPLSVDRLQQLFPESECPEKPEIRKLLEQLSQDCADRGVELVEVASGYRYQAKASTADMLQRLWDRKPARYTRAFLETLALIAYRQPVTRGEIEEVRGVAVSSNIMRQLQEREWVKVVGHKDVPGKPALFGTTKQFLDYFSLKKLSDLPALQEVMDLEEVEKKLGEQLTLDVDAVAKPIASESGNETIAVDNDNSSEDALNDDMIDALLSDDVVAEPA